MLKHPIPARSRNVPAIRRITNRFAHISKRKVLNHAHKFLSVINVALSMSSIFGQHLGVPS